MKRVIKSSDDWLIDNLMHGKKFRVCAEEERCFTTDDPKSAITKWFKFGAKHPTDSAITVLGLFVGAAFAHNFKLVGNATETGPNIWGKSAVILGIVIALLIAFFNSEIKEEK